MRPIIKFAILALLYMAAGKLSAQVDSLPSEDSVQRHTDSTYQIYDTALLYEDSGFFAPQNVVVQDNIPQEKDWWGNGLRIVNMHSTRVLQKRHLDFCIQHRFGLLSGGKGNFYGLDESYYRLGFDYGLTSKITIGVGRSNVGKILNGYIKWSLIQQNEDHLVSVTWFSDMAATLEHPPSGLEPYYWTHRVKYTHQIILAHTFGDSRFMLQLAPTIVHRNLVDSASEPNDLALITSDLRWRLTKRISLTGEYGFLFHRDMRGQLNGTLGGGIEFYTSRHVFQLLFTNAYYMNEAGVLTMQNGSVRNGDFRFGFNIVRSF